MQPGANEGWRFIPVLHKPPASMLVLILEVSTHAHSPNRHPCDIVEITIPKPYRATGTDKSTLQLILVSVWVPTHFVLFGFS